MQKDWLTGLYLIAGIVLACFCLLGTTGCGRTDADLCIQSKIRRLARIDHEQPSEGAISELIAFCKAEYPRERP